jgi:hypothetical protein
MFKARANQPITCETGHEVGRFRNDVPSDRHIKAEDLDLPFSDSGGAVETPDKVATGHTCAKCKGRVTYYQDGEFRVHTESGWIL